ncbi:MAG TPA: DUF2804 domain-containing protein [Myxococcota bacterium]|nr:DUF2804 domain-containing protein [Myxococcota bacterium]HOD00078.1 DUF2804 domain-containing protein [Myxococcota bacterium]HPV04985.1 DUF2804 domain-containing protein [Myxococcota bacterium]
MMKVVDTPEKMVVSGQAVYGRFATPFRNVNLDDQKIDVFGLPVPKPLRTARLKEWAHVAIVGPEVTIGCAVVDAKYLSNAWFWAADRATGKFIEHAAQCGGGAIKTSRQLYNGQTDFKGGGFKVEIDDQLDKNQHVYHIEIKAGKDLPAIRADFVLHADWRNNNPLVVVLPAAPGRPLYTHKSVTPVSGMIAVGNRVYQLESDKYVAMLDIQKTYYPYRIFWEWATFGGYDAKGRLIGLNLCHNLIKDDETYNENCLWVEGRLHNLAPARFEYDSSDYLKPWHLKTVDGSVDLEFRPEGKRDGMTDAKVLLSDYHQPFGSFHGFVTTEDGERIEIDGIRGVTEDHKAKF